MIYFLVPRAKYLSFTVEKDEVCVCAECDSRSLFSHSVSGRTTNMSCDITNSLEANSGPIFSVQCDPVSNT